jgi:hypothetical protein
MSKNADQKHKDKESENNYSILFVKAVLQNLKKEVN